MNIVSLTLGIAAILYIFTYIFHQSGFDRFHTKSERIYRCVADVKFGNTVEKLTNSQIPLAETALNDLPEVEAATRLFYDEKVNLEIENKCFYENIFWYAEGNFFQIFDFNLLSGDKNTVLTEPNTIILTENYSKQLFGIENPIGKIIKVKELQNSFRVTGILENIPANSHLQFKFLASFKSIPNERLKRMSDWGNFASLYTYLLLNENTNISSFKKKYNDFPNDYVNGMLKNLNLSLAQFARDGNYFDHRLQPLNEIYLDPVFSDQIHKYGNKQHLVILAIIALFILIIACLNFINLSTAFSSLRAKEIGIKKVIGSSKNKLIVQILSETFLQCSIALISALVILFFGLSVLNQFTDIDIEYQYFYNTYSILTILLIPVVITAMAGIYPAIIISKFNPVVSLKGNLLNRGAKLYMRNGLVAFQFIVFIVLVCSTILVKKQLLFLRSQNPGFNKENVLIVKNSRQLKDKRLIFKDELLKSPDVLSASYTSALPSMFDDASNMFQVPNSNEKVILNRIFVDEDFEKTLKIEIAEGSFFTEERGNENNNALVNRKAAEMLGWRDIQDKVIYDFNYRKQYNIIGIVEDFNIKSFKEEILPFIIRKEAQHDYLAVRIQPQSAVSVVKLIEEKWKQFNMKSVLDYEFLDRSFDNQYKAEVRLGKMVGLFSFISILIACFGLFGLVSFIANRKVKEIGIRKVNGAKVSEILTMLNKDFIKWVVIAFVIAAPIAYYAMNKWLENFAYKTTLSWWIFALAGVLALGIALLTVSFQSWKAATRNPVEALRYE
ncbi:ABC transporter permease [Mariniphaga sediminis]|uniref:ABC transporter permease n=1 Tax=Mariniphaga sediminis TaxID=1628158 RepID=UPI0015599663|nr:ABC transporter permease [Mariniphaga sediminis]